MSCLPLAGVLAGVLAVFSSAPTATAQVEQGRYLIGLTGGFSWQSFDVQDFLGRSERLTQWQLALDPSLLYLLSDDFALGGRLGLSVSRFDNSFDDDTNVTFSVAPAARYYFGEGEGNRLFASASAGVAFFNDDDTDALFQGSAGLGYSFFFNDGLAVEPGIEAGFGAGELDFFQFSVALGLQGFVDALVPRSGAAD